MMTTREKGLLRILLFSFIFLVYTKVSISKEPDISVYKIWDQAMHNGFPDLIRFNNAFYCSLREGNNHVDNTNTGKLRILKSKDGKKWESIALFELEGIEIREGRLSVTPQGNIMITVGAGVYNNHFESLATYVSFSDKSGLNFSPLEKNMIDPLITTQREWIWRVTWNQGIGYGILYQVYERPWKAFVVQTKDGKYYERVAKINVDRDPNESTIRFDKNNRMYILVRRESGDKMGVLAEGDFPYRNFTYYPLKEQLGGPNFLFLNYNRLVIGSRSVKKTGSVMALHVSDLQGNILKTIKLPSRGDNSYPGMVIYKRKLWVVYYSSHEGKANIYMAVIPLKNFEVK